MRRRPWCERYGCATHGSILVWIDAGALGVLPVWACRACAAPYQRNPAREPVLR